MMYLAVYSVVVTGAVREEKVSASSKEKALSHAKEWGKENDLRLEQLWRLEALWSR